MARRCSFSNQPSPNWACSLSLHPALQSLSTAEAAGVAQVVAFCSTQTSPSPCPRPLVPFALWLALPTSLVGHHSHDYYETSVAVTLAGGRRSRIPSLFDVLA